MNLAEDTITVILDLLSLHLQEKGISYSSADLRNVLSTPAQKVVISTSKTCIYTPSKNKNKGIPCGKPCLEGQDYCRTCMNKEVVKKKLKIPLVQASPLSRVAETEVVKEEKEYKLGLEPIPELSPGHYFVPSLHYIVRKDKPSETYIVLGCGEKE